MARRHGEAADFARYGVRSDSRRRCLQLLLQLLHASLPPLPSPLAHRLTSLQPRQRGEGGQGRRREEASAKEAGAGGGGESRGEWVEGG